ncbi:hypothetical protein D0463_13650 [Bacillus sp. V59.32b]|nr:hypothetical protein D0463_13650 [Bacillus sp. V59.32b]
MEVGIAWANTSGVLHHSDRVWWDASFASSKYDMQQQTIKAINVNSDTLKYSPVSKINQIFPLKLNNWHRLFYRKKLLRS